MNPTKMLYTAANEPVVSDLQPASGHCYLCGEAVEVAVPTKKRLKKTWTAHDTAAMPESDWLCPACVWSLSEKATHPEQSKPFKMRTQSHFVNGGKWRVLGLSDKAVMRDILLSPPDGDWMLALCDSPLSASHIIYNTPINTGSTWAVNLGGTLTPGNPRLLAELLKPIEQLYNASHTKTNISTGNYTTKYITAQGEAAWAECEAIILPHRGKPLFELAIFLAQKDE